ncbi:carboxylesterase [Solimonas sp. K1W22B-7]|uniref:alpha/beta hydrolase n=1 Tax=Solimonas sp. K1W22B-7 TaxID=2303331 RepID=UPI000E33293F|nr:dienelactone hydrolase family protein [Solimonas sp. K1W22B-7]AXQ31424.1 carboxylesterase [Solimonas sp. K1W22B-7]
MKKHETADAVRLEPDAPADATVIWLHGLGADGHDFVPIVPALGLPPGHRIRFLFPHAKIQPVTINGGMPMPAWYDIPALDRDSRQDEAGLRESEKRIAGLIDAEIAAGIAARRIVLAGFSQGGAITLHLGVRYPQQLGGLIALSTYMPLHQKVQTEIHPESFKTPIFMAHGRFDPVVAFNWGSDSARGLRAAGYELEWHEYAMQHEVCAEEIERIGAWLLERLG